MMNKVLLLLFLLTTLPALAKVTVNVGAYRIPPFYNNLNGISKGITVDLVEFLNANQSDFYFKLVETSPRRRYRDLKNGVYDIIFFENPVWGWDYRKIDYTVSRVFAIGYDLYIAKKGRDKNSIFENLKDKTILLKSGFHYGFLNQKSFDVKDKNLIYTTSQKGNIENVIRGKADLTIVNDTFLKLMIKERPALKNEIIVSDKKDQTHEFRVLSRKNSPITIKQVEELFPLIKANKKFQSILEFL